MTIINHTSGLRWRAEDLGKAHVIDETMKEETTLTHLDSLRAKKMHELLNEEGERYIWQYDIIPRKQALREAIFNQDFDNMQFDSEAKTEYCLVGSGICDHPFTTPEELTHLIEWLCGEGGYLGCYAKN